MIGIIGALQEEVAGLVDRLQDSHSTIIGGTEFFCGSLFGKEVAVALSGVGKVNAAMTTAFMLAEFPDITAIINIGVAGGIAKGMRQGDMIIADKSVQHDFTLNVDTIPLGKIPGFDSAEFICDERLVKLAEQTLHQKGITYHVGTIASGDEFINSDAKVRFLSQHFGAIGCDMETAAIAHVCYKTNTKFLSIRSVSDSGGDGADLAFDEFVQNAAKISIDCATSLIQSIQP